MDDFGVAEDPVEEPTAGEPGEDGSFEGAEPQDSPAPSAPPQQPAYQAPPQQASPTSGGLGPLVERLPAGLKRAIAAGQLSPEAAVVRHYQGYTANVDRANQVAKELRGQNAQALARLEALTRHLTDTLGIALPEEQPQAPPDPVSILTDKVDQFLSSAEEQQLERTIDQVDAFVASDRAAIMAEEPEYDSASEFVTQHLISFQTEQVQKELGWWGMTHDQNLLRGFNPEYLQAVVDGQMSEEELIQRTALERCINIAAETHQRNFTSRQSSARELLAIARRLGWTPTREGGQPVAHPQPQRVQPAAPLPARRNPALDSVRRNVSHTPAPAHSVALDPKEAARRFATMGQQEFDAMMDRSDNPEGLLKEILALVAVH